MAQIESGKYIIDTDEVTCTCRDFKFRRCYHPKLSEQRLCKHLLAVKDQLDIPLDSETMTEEQELNFTGHKSVRIPWGKALETVREVIYNSLSELESKGVLIKYEFCGSYRRKKETVADLDCLLVVSDVAPIDFVWDQLSEGMAKCFWSGPKKTSYLTTKGVQLDYRVVPEESFPYALLHYTGSKENNIRLRGIAKRKGYQLNEYGLYYHGTKNLVNSNIKTEQDIFTELGEAYLEPTDR